MSTSNQSDSESSISYTFSEDNSADLELFKNVPDELYIHGYSPEQMPAGLDSDNKDAIDFASIIRAAREAAKQKEARSSKRSATENDSNDSSELSSVHYSTDPKCPSGELHYSIAEGVEAIKSMVFKEEGPAPVFPRSKVKRPSLSKESQPFYTSPSTSGKKNTSTRMTRATTTKKRAKRLQTDSAEDEESTIFQDPLSDIINDMRDIKLDTASSSKYCYRSTSSDRPDSPILLVPNVF